MKRLIIAFAVLFSFLAVVPEPAEALFGRRRGRRSVSVGTGNFPVQISTDQWTVGDRKMTLQQIAQERADAMAAHGNLSHGIEYTGECPSAPVAEGIGCATWEKPEDVATCICGSTVIADAHAKSSNGMWYRVRFWR